MARLARLATCAAATTLLAVASTPWFVSPATAADSGATCTLDITLTLRPGLTLMPSTGSIISPTPGALTCVGVIDGSLVTGPGQFSVRGTYSGSLAMGTSTGTAAYSIPTTAGLAGGEVDYGVTWVGTAGFITVEDDVYGNGSGPFAFLPNGNGVTRPVTSIRWFSQQITFGSGARTPAA